MIKLLVVIMLFAFGITNNLLKEKSLRTDCYQDNNRKEEVQRKADALKKSLRRTKGIPKDKLNEYDQYIDDYKNSELKAATREDEKKNWMNLMNRLNLPMSIVNELMKNYVEELIISKKG